MRWLLRFVKGNLTLVETVSCEVWKAEQSVSLNGPACWKTPCWAWRDREGTLSLSKMVRIRIIQEQYARFFCLTKIDKRLFQPAGPFYGLCSITISEKQVPSTIPFMIISLKISLCSFLASKENRRENRVEEKLHLLRLRKQSFCESRVGFNRLWQ